VPALIVIALTFAVAEPDRVPDHRPAAFSWRMADFPAAFRRYLLALSLFTLGNSSNMFLLLRAKELGLDDAQVPLAWALVAFVAAALSTPLSALSDRIDRKRLIVGGWSVYAVLYLLFGLLPAMGWLLWPLFACYGVFLAATEGAEKALVADLVPRDKTGTAFGWYNLVIGTLLLPASIIFGWLWSSETSLAAFGFGAACAVGAAALLRFWVAAPIAPEAAQPR
jgi:MFS family permease